MVLASVESISSWFVDLIDFEVFFFFFKVSALFQTVSNYDFPDGSMQQTICCSRLIY